MTRTTRRTVCFIAIIVALSLVFTFFAVATEGFTESNGAAWFNYWGKGAPTTAAPKQAETEDRTAAQSNSKRKSAVNAGLTYDSDDATATVTVIKEVAPTIKMTDDGRISVQLITNRMGVPANYVPPECVVEVAPFYCEFSTSGSIDTTKKKELKRFTFNIISTKPIKSDPVYITRDEIVELFPESYNSSSYYPCFQFAAYTLDNDYSLGSSSAYLTCYVDKTEPTVAVDNGSISVTIPVQTPPEDISFGKYFFIRKTIIVGQTEPGNKVLTSLPFDTNSTVSGLDTAEKENAIVNDKAFSVSDNDFYYTFLDSSFVTQIGTYALEVRHYTLNSEYSGAQGSHRFLIDCPVLMPTIVEYFSISRLSSPTNIRVENYVLKWDEVEGAEGYAVFEDSRAGKWTLKEPEIDIRKMSMPEGEYTFRVRALGNVGAALATSELADRALTAYNASSVVTQVVALTYHIDGDIVSKFVPYGNKLSDYLYDVNIPKKEFGGWYYDSGFSRAVEGSDVLTSDMTIYARLSDVKVTDRPLSWWELHMWQVLIPVIVVVALAAIGGISVVVVKKRKNK